MIFLDSSVLVSAFDASHPFYETSIRLLKDCTASTSAASTHSLAETYASITRLPLTPRPLPEHAMRYIHSIRHRLSWIALEKEDYVTTLEICAARQLRGGKIYDALLFQAALKASARVLYTWNSRDFDMLATGTDIVIRTPDDM